MPRGRNVPRVKEFHKFSGHLLGQQPACSLQRLESEVFAPVMTATDYGIGRYTRNEWVQDDKPYNDNRPRCFLNDRY